jgi:hypothetical protein
MFRSSAAAILAMFLLLPAGPAFAQDEPLPSMEDPPPIEPPEQAPDTATTSPPTRQPAPRAQRKAAPSADEDEPVVRAESGNLGMFFLFGGLATLLHTNDGKSAGGLVFQRVGMEYVLSQNLRIPFWFGTGLELTSPDQGDSSTDWGMEIGGGIEYHFRIWRRISPYVGGTLGIGVGNPSGPDNVDIEFSLGPMFGVEYYIGDRVSLSAQYELNIDIGYEDSANATTTFGYRTEAGGSVGITYYF